MPSVFLRIMAEAYYEHITLALRPKTMERLAPLIRQAGEEEWEDEAVGTELANLANDMESRLQRIAVGDKQQVSP